MDKYKKWKLKKICALSRIWTCYPLTLWNHATPPCHMLQEENLTKLLASNFLLYWIAMGQVKIAVMKTLIITPEISWIFISPNNRYSVLVPYLQVFTDIIHVWYGLFIRWMKYVSWSDVIETFEMNSFVVLGCVIPLWIISRHAFRTRVPFGEAENGFSIRRFPFHSNYFSWNCEKW